MNVGTYIGSELELFSHATNWKSYLAKELGPYLKGDVLEVGAGIGGTTSVLYKSQDSVKTWRCLEPDSELAAQIEAKIAQGDLPKSCSVARGTIADLDPSLRFDSILYIDVLEHIEDDLSELAHACSRLRKGGYLIVLTPAHNFLFSEFDASIGHFRRYDKRRMKQIEPVHLKRLHFKYLDAVGLFASLANKLLLKQRTPSKGQIEVWDKFMVTASRGVDPLLLNRFGKSLLAVWTTS